MKNKTKNLIPLIKTLLTDNNEYIPAEKIAQRFKISKVMVYKVIRLLRESGIGVLSCPQGYILSEFAKKKDDVHFLRRLHGRRTSDHIALYAAFPHIKKRWSTISEQKRLKLLTGPLQVNVRTMERNQRVLALL